jgi:hypothetical protein
MWKSAGRAPSLRVFTLAFAVQLRKKHVTLAFALQLFHYVIVIDFVVAICINTPGQ